MSAAAVTRQFRSSGRQQKMKRFYKDVTVRSSETGYQIYLDNRPVRSLAKAVVEVPVCFWLRLYKLNGRRLKTKFSQKICLFIQWRYW